MWCRKKSLPFDIVVLCLVGNWVAVVKPGRVLFELADVSEDVAHEALRLASHKLPVRCKFVKREELDTVKEGDAE